MHPIFRIAELIERDAWLDLFDAAPDHVREHLGLRASRIGSMGLLGCREVIITELNRAMAVGVESVPRRRDLEAATEWLEAHARSAAMQVAPDAGDPVISEYLDEGGWAAAGSGWAKFVATGRPRPLDPIDRPVRIEVVRGPVADSFGRAVTRGFGLPDVCAAWFAALAERPFWRCFAAVIDGEVAAGGAMFARDGAAWFGIEATLDPYRGRGAQRSIVAAQLDAAAAAGATVVTCETAKPERREDPGFASYRNQERSGLSHAYTRINYKANR